jgi:hypothetical protein
MAVIVGVLVVALLLAVAAGAFLLGRSGNDDSDVATDSTTTVGPTTSSAAPSTSVTTTTVRAPAPTAPPNRDPQLLPAGLFCRDLADQGYSYSAAVDYWRREGLPDRMDADRNGIPCETVYARADIVSYWPAETYETVTAYGLPPGLLCRDLQDRGVGVYDALRYYIWEGQPDRMDADGNGIPCETVYPDAATVWLTEF